jgi:hypothetical protein
MGKDLPTHAASPSTSHWSLPEPMPSGSAEGRSPNAGGFRGCPPDSKYNRAGGWDISLPVWGHKIGEGLGGVVNRRESFA